MGIILGSQSKGRKRVMDELSKELGFEYEIMSADIDEKAIRSDDYYKLPLLVARAKSEVLRKRIYSIKEPTILITGDTVIIQNGELHEKPESEPQARHWLETFHLYPLYIANACIVVNTENNKIAEESYYSKVIFSEIPKNVIDGIISDKSAMTLAGAFGIQNSRQAKYITQIEGDISNVLGLDKEILKRLMEEVK